MLLFWNPKSAEDVEVHQQVAHVARTSGGKVVVHYALAKQVGSFGSITEAIQISQTPTLVLINKHSQATTLTGLMDSFSIEQAVSEAEQAPAKA